MREGLRSGRLGGVAETDSVERGSISSEESALAEGSGGIRDNGRKRRRIDVNTANAGVCGDEKNVKEPEEEVFRRVLRSSDVKKTNAAVGTGEPPQQKVHPSDGCEGKLGEADDAVAIDDSNGVGNQLKRKPGRPRLSNSESPRKNDPEMLTENVKRKRGRPPKSPETHGLDIKMRDKINPRRGRPPKAKSSENNLGLGVPLIEKIKPKLGRPPKTQDRLDVKLTRKFKPKRGRPPMNDSLDDDSREKMKPKRGRPPKNDSLDNDCREKMKPKLGRPLKVREPLENGSDEKTDVQDQVVKIDGSVDTSKKVMNGRPPPKTKDTDVQEALENGFDNNTDVSVQVDKVDGIADMRNALLKPKLGRPPKDQDTVGSLKKTDEAPGKESVQSHGEDLDKSCGRVRKKLKPSKADKPKTLGFLRKQMKATDNVLNNTGNTSLLPSKKLVSKESKINKLGPAPDKDHHSDVREGKAKQKSGERKRSLQKQAVRDKIVQLLLGAGWTVQHRPRNGRDYADAVYVNPEGRTHWSVTLAYRMLKKQYDKVGGGSETCQPGFKFIPLPEEEISILGKVICKERIDKNKKKKKWKQGGKKLKVPCVTVKGKKKQKLHDTKMGITKRPRHKILKGKARAKSSISEQDDSDVILDSEKAGSGRYLKRRGTNGQKGCSLMIRNPNEGIESDGNGYVLYGERRTIIGWMIDLGTVALDAKVQFSKSRRIDAVRKGKILINGIQCDCCGEVLSISRFEAHAGSKSPQPFKNIYLEDGRSLLQCLLDSWHKEAECIGNGFHSVDISGADPNDEACGICGDGGDLICCDACPSTFHQSCLNIEELPSGVWHCIYCSCKFCGMADQKNICHNDDAAPVFGLNTCSLCEEKYHLSCIQLGDAVNVSSSSPSFCGKKCQELFEKLQTLIGVKHELEEGLTWTLIRRFDIGSDISLKGMHSKIECNCKVAVASSIMDECFLPMQDHRSGVNLIRNIVYNFGSNFNRLNYRGFLTAILESGDEIIAAASIRIHGNYLAEMPFIGTRYMYRRQGMCRRLLTGIETALCSLNVEKLVIPAISELRDTWTSAFGFKPLGGLKERMKKMNMMVFPGVDMLEKQLLKDQSAEDSTIHAYGLKPLEEKGHQTADGKHQSAEVANRIHTEVANRNHTDGLASVEEDKHQSADVKHQSLEDNTVDDADGCCKQTAVAKGNPNLDCSDVSNSDATTKPSMQASDSFGVDKDGVHDPRKLTVGGFPVNGGLNSEKLATADPEVDHPNLTKCKSESLCSSSSATAVAL